MPRPAHPSPPSPPSSVQTRRHTDNRPACNQHDAEDAPPAWKFFYGLGRSASAPVNILLLVLGRRRTKPLFGLLIGTNKRKVSCRLLMEGLADPV